MLRLYGSVIFPNPDVAWTPEQGGLDKGAQLIQEGGREAVMRAGQGNIVTLNVLFPKPGLYRLAVEGQHDRPGPVILDVQINGTRRGQISFEADDGSWGTRTLQITAERAGVEQLTLVFSNDIYLKDVIDKGGDGDRNALIDRVWISSLTSNP